ncbi:MAG: hypothetical protein OXE52_07015 [Chloroflexi bacterium]|nr:hypothetical protein [Chloroflexota bacterium]
MSYNDTIYIKSSHESPEIAEAFCQQIFDDYEISVIETFNQKRTSVYAYPFSIDTFPYNPPEFMKQMAKEDYGFVPNFNVPIFYSKSEEIWIKNNGEWDLPPLRDVILKGVIGLLKRTDYSLVLKLDNSTRHVLFRHADQLTLLEDPFWTEERLRLFKDIPYTFKREG